MNVITLSNVVPSEGWGKEETFRIECSIAQVNTFALIPSVVSFSSTCITSPESLLGFLFFSYIFKRLLGHYGSYTN